MAYYEDEDWPVSQANFGVGYDPLAQGRYAALPTFSPRIGTPGAEVPQVLMPGGTANVPMLDEGKRGSAEGPNALQPTDAGVASGPDFNSLAGLLQMKGLMSIVAPETAASTAAPAAVSASDVRPGSSSSGPHPRNVSNVSAGGYQPIVDEMAAKYNVDPKQLTHQLFLESGFNEGAKSHAGAVGIGQFMPGTAPRYGMKVGDGVDERTDPRKSIEGAAHYMSDLKKMFNGNDQLALMGYNWGEGNVHKWLVNGADVNKVPKETRDYVRAITGRDIAPTHPPAGGGDPRLGSSVTQNPADIPARGVGAMALMEAAKGGGFNVPPGKDEKKKKSGVQNVPLDQTPLPPPRPREPMPDYDQGTPNLGGGITRPQLPTQEPGQTAPAPAPAETSASTQTPFASTDPNMDKLWKYILIKSLLPQIQFRNIGYDPWAVHRFGQSGGY